MDNLGLRKSLLEIRESINIAKQTWTNNDTTNCYAYALGLDIPDTSIKRFAYDPGVISGQYERTECGFSYEEFIRRMIADFNALGIDYGSIDPSDPVEKNEWKIALFLRRSGKGLDNFHFLRQREDGLWYHKVGFDNDVSIVDSFGHLITDPRECCIYSGEYDSCFRLRLK